MQLILSLVVLLTFNFVNPLMTLCIMQGFGKKYRKPSGERMIFSTNPKGLTLFVREEHELPLPVVMGTRLRYARFSRYVFIP